MALWRVRMAWTGIYGSNSLSTHYFDDSVAASPADCVTATKTFWTDLEPYFSSGLTWSTDPAVDTLSLTGTLTGTTGVVPQFGSGTNGTNLTPQQTQGRIFWQTGVIVAGRRLQGATFIPGIPLNDLDSQGNFATSTITAVNTIANAFASGTGLVVWSRKHATIANPTVNTLDVTPRVLRSRRD